VRGIENEAFPAVALIAFVSAGIFSAHEVEGEGALRRHHRPPP